MVYCEKLFEGLDKRLEQQKTLDVIGIELCSTVKDPRDKAMRLIEAHKGKEYLIENAKWLGYDTGHIRNPNGNSRKKFSQLSEKEKQVEKIKQFIKKNGYEPDLYDVMSMVDSTLTYNENLKLIQDSFPILKPRTKWHEYEPKLLEQIQFADYDELLSLLDISIEIVRNRNTNGWQDIEDIIIGHLEIDESVWDYEPMEIYVTPEPEEMMG